MDLYNHKTRDISIPIVSLEDSHLLNIIRMHLSNISNAKIFAEQKEKPTDTVTALLYKNQPQIDPAQLITKAHESLMPYILEAQIRGLTDQYQSDLEQAYGRIKTQPLLEATY